MSLNHESERELLSDAWRILGQLGLVDTIFNHISSVIADSEGQLQLLLNRNTSLPAQLRPEDVCVTPLREYDSDEAENLGVNPDGLQLHSSLHIARMKPGVIIHTHSLNCLAVGCTEQSLLPISQTSLEFVNSVRTIEYFGVFRATNLTKELEELAFSGGAAFLRNHGALFVADTIPEAVYLAYYLEEACRIQVATLSQGVPFVTPGNGIIDQVSLSLIQERPRVSKRLFTALRKV